MKEQLKKKETWIAIIIMVLVANVVAFGLYFLTAYTTIFGSFNVNFPFGVEIVILLFIIIYFAYGFIVTDFREARVRRKEKNWAGKLSEKEIAHKRKHRTAPWISSAILLLVVIVLEIISFFVK
jgi:membrane protein implicated in regulation of membrane protease activity